MREGVQQSDSADTTAGGGQRPPGGTRALAGLGIFSGLGAVAAKSCCLLPLLLASSGFGGAWLSQELIAYRPYFLGTAWAAVAVAWVVAVRRRRTACAPGKTCNTAGWVSYGLLALSTLIVGLATAWGWLEPVLVHYLMAGSG